MVVRWNNCAKAGDNTKVGLTSPPLDPPEEVEEVVEVEASPEMICWSVEDWKE